MIVLNRNGGAKDDAGSSELRKFFEQQVKPYVQGLLRQKADKARTLSGYGIRDVEISQGVIAIGGKSFDTASVVSKTTRINGQNLSGDVEINASDVDAVATESVGVANGVCPLDANAKIDAQYLPSLEAITTAEIDVITS